MQVTSGSDWVIPASGNRRNYAVAFDSNDGKVLMGEKWDTMTFSQQMKALQQRADVAVLTYMHDEGALPDDFFKMRVQQILAG